MPYSGIEPEPSPNRGVVQSIHSAIHSEYIPEYE